MKSATFKCLIAMIPSFSAVAGSGGGASAEEKAAAKGPLAHMVFFSLKESTPENQKKLVAACNKYLAKHPGILYYSAGILAGDLARPVNDREFDVGLHLVFESKEAHDRYQDAPDHVRFVTENKETWKKVRVFDSYLDAAK